MQEWVKVLAAAVPVAALLVLVVVFHRRWCSFNGRRRDFVETSQVRNESLQSGIARLHLASDAKNLASLNHQLEVENKRKANYYVIRRGVSAKPVFNWADNPWLVSEAVEHGWSRFAFTVYTSSPSTGSALLLCGRGDEGREREAEISWEVFPGSADFMQKVRLNSGLKKINSGTSSLGASCVIKTALPLPGPPLGDSSFPQEAYFEITILSCQGDDQLNKVKRSSNDGERTKLIQETAESKANSDSLMHVASCNGDKRFGESKLIGSQKEGKGEAVMLSLGLTGGGSLPLKLPGSYPGSIGFNSNGSVYLDGTKLVFEAEKAEWGRTNKVIGCGFDPYQKKVFFTVDSELLHVIHCKSEDFGSPLYPTLAANVDVLVVINFGQSAFKYAPANSRRTPNPCFVDAVSNAQAAVLGYEDSKELFSMGRIDSQWRNRSTNNKNSHGNATPIMTGSDMDADSEADLFEIVLDRYGRSPSTIQQL